jgi:hypothetical protein
MMCEGADIEGLEKMQVELCPNCGKSLGANCLIIADKKYCSWECYRT